VSTPKPHLDSFAIATMVVLCAFWGLNYVAAKVSADGVSYVAQAAIRFIVGVVLLLAWARLRRIPLFERDGSFWVGLGCGFLFFVEFLLIFHGLDHTTAARMIVLVYLQPCFAALGLAWFLPGDRLGPLQWLGILLGFAGVAVSFADGIAAGDGSTLYGDACAAIAGFLWGVTTVMVRVSRLSRISATKTFFYQAIVAAVLLPPSAWLLGESGITKLTPLILASLFYQSVIVTFGTLLVWYWLLKQYSAARLSGMSFLTPLFGLAAGVAILDEPLTFTFAAGALLVVVGIVLVNFRPPRPM